MAKEITVSIHPDGTTTVEASGFTGGSCTAATKFVEDALDGKVVTREMKPEAAERILRTQQQLQGGLTVADVEVFIYPSGTVRAVYSRASAELLSEGSSRTVHRASTVEEVDGKWFADLSRVGGPRLGPFPFEARDLAIAAEVAWLNEHYLPNCESWPEEQVGSYEKGTTSNAG